MVSYRRNYLPGGTYFFTVTLRDRRSSLLVDRVDSLYDALRVVASRKPFQIVAGAVLPDHLHVVMRLPAGDADYSGRWRAIKGRFTMLLHRDRERKYAPWQSRFWEHTIRDARDLRMHVDYIHYNPVKHGLVRKVADWPHSSFHRYRVTGRLPRDWGGEHVEPAGWFGER